MSLRVSAIFDKVLLNCIVKQQQFGAGRCLHVADVVSDANVRVALATHAHRLLQMPLWKADEVVRTIRTKDMATVPEKEKRYQHC